MRLLLALFLLINIGFAYEDDIEADQAYAMQKEKEAIIVDVRTSIEFIYVGHGQGFINIPYLDWSYEQKSIEERVKSAQYEVENDTVKDHIAIQKIFNAKENVNKEFVSQVRKAMKLADVNSVILVCRSGPRSKAAADVLTGAGIKAYNLNDGFNSGWKLYDQPWGGE